MGNIDIDPLVPDNDVRPLWRKQPWWTYVVVLVVVLCLVTGIVLAVTLPFKGKIDNNVYCKTSECHDMSRRLSASMDTSFQPCNDFYQYMCGKYTPSKHGFPSETAIAVSDVNTKLKYVLTNLDTSVLPSLAGLAQVLYQSCMDTILLELLSAKPAIDLMDEYYSGFNITDKDSAGSFNDILITMGNTHGAFPLFAPVVFVDFDNANEYKITMMPPNYPLVEKLAGIPSTDYNILHNAIVGSRLAIELFASSVVEIYGNKNDTNVTNSINDIISLLNEHTQIMERVSIIPESLANMTLSQLQDTLNTSKVDVVEYVNSVMPKKVESSESISILGIDYFINLGMLLEKYSENDLNIYLKFLFASELMPHLSENYNMLYIGMLIYVYEYYLSNLEETAHPQQNIDSLVNSINLNDDDRANTCLVTLSEVFPMPLGYLYISANDVVPGGDIQQWNDLVNDIHATFINSTSSWTWMDENTREYANEKARDIDSSIAFPPLFDNVTELQLRYHNVHMKPDSYLRNVIMARNFSAYDMLFNNYGNPVERRNFPPMVFPQTFNAFYYPSTNAMYVLAAFMQPPGYFRKAPEFQLYGAGGYVAGHEFTHAFDNTGRRYDGTGTYENWWSNATDMEFLEKALCYVNQYSNMDLSPYTTNKISGNLTLGETIADSGGVHAAWNAFQHWKIHNPEEAKQILPGINMNSDQLFFASLTQFYCSLVTTDIIEAALLDVHPPDPYRVLGMLQNSEAFSETFHCAVGTKYNPKNKCILY